jgi:phosphoglycerol transferase MdoB-like AlkP superfamily enzyme
MPIIRKSYYSLFHQPTITSLFFCFFLYAFFISLQYLLLPEVSISFIQILSILFGVGDHLFYALFSTLLLILLHRLRLPLAILIILSIFISFILIADRVFYQVFYQHLSLSAYESGTTFIQLWGSFYSELGFIDILNLIICLLIQIPIINSLKQTKLALFPHFINWERRLVIKLTILVALTMLFSYVFTVGNLHFNPLVRIGFSLIKPSTNIYIPQHNNQEMDHADKEHQPNKPSLEVLKELSQPIYAAANSQANISKQTDNKKPFILSAKQQKKNIILIILESVGALQLFPDGQISEKTTPFLSSIKQHSTLFNSIYTYYPATTRAHVPIQTGGLSITYATTKQLQYPYLGSTLVSSLKHSGYYSALFSAQKLDFGNLDKLYQQMGFDFYFDPDTAGKQFFKENSVGSWGVFETAVLPKTFNWIDQSLATQKPFFLEFFTSSSHHPYVYPGSKAERKKLSRFERYTKSLRYTDKVLQQIWDNLKKRQLLDNTVIYVTGDHGQAFGRRHKKNFTHRNYIYEENIRSFLLRIDTSQQQQISIDRPGSIGDIMPTIIANEVVDKQKSAMVNNKVLGQNLYAENYQQRLQFFHKHQIPAQWGVRDGQWKYISRQTGIKHAELYDLSTDPGEQHNLAKLHPKRVVKYQQRVAQWSAAMQQNFAGQLQAKNLLNLSSDDLSNKGPKQLRIGIRAKNSSFEQWGPFHPDEDIVAQVYRVPDDVRHDYHFIWRSPKGKETRKLVKVKPDWERVYNDLDYPQTMEEGQWQLKVITNEGKQFEQYFTVSKNAKLIDPRYRAMGPRHLSLGYQDKTGQFHKKIAFHPFEQIVVQGEGLPYPSETKLDMYWIAPSKKEYHQSLTIGKNKPNFSSLFNKKWPLESGLWKVKIKRKSVLLAETSLQIGSNNTLYQTDIINREQRIQELKQKYVVNKINNKQLNTIVIIDNEINKAHMQIYGYHRQNMPALQQSLNQGDLLSFTSVYNAQTEESANKFPLLIPTINESNQQGKNSPTLIDIMNASSIQTIWFGSNKSTSYEQFYSQLVQTQYLLPETKKEIDQQKLIQQIKHILQNNRLIKGNNNSTSGNFIFIHLSKSENTLSYGKKCTSDSPYNENLTEGEFGRNANNQSLTQKLNCHDNHLIKVDELISKLTRLPELQQTPSMIWYSSNYTPHIFEKEGHLGENLSNKIRDIPLIAWFSNTYQHYYSDKLTLLKQHKNAQFSIDMLFNTLIGLMPINTTLYNPVNDTGNSFFQEIMLNAELNNIDKDDETFNKYIQRQNIHKLKDSKLDSRLLPHRVNSIGKLSQVLYDGYQAFEVDVIFRANNKGSGYFEVGHDEKALAGLSLQHLLSQSPSTIKKIWFDIKNITAENINAVLARLNELNKIFPVKKKVIIESDIPSPVFAQLADAGFYTSYYLPTQKLISVIKNNNQDKLVKLSKQILLQIKQQRVKAISFDSKLYSYVKNNIEPELSQDLDYHTWDMLIPFKDPNFLVKISQKAYYLDSRVKTILLAYYSEFTL